MTSYPSPVSSTPSDILFGPSPLQAFLNLIRKNIGLVCLGLLLGLLMGLVAYAITPKVYRAKGTFLIDRLPFRIVQEGMSDAETERQLVQSLILSIPGEELRTAVATRLGVGPSDIAFAQHDHTIALSSHHPFQANVEITATRNSRLGVVTAESSDPEFATKIVHAIFSEMEVINQIAGRLLQIQSRLKLEQTESENLIQALGAVSADRIKYEEQNQSLDQFLADKNPPEAFPAFNEDATLNNLKTQMILVSSEYDALAVQDTFGAKLAGKKAELTGLRLQIQKHVGGLVAALRTALQIARSREASFKKDLDAVQQQSAALETLSAQLAKGVGDFKLREELIANGNASLVSEASVIVVVDPAYTMRTPVRPSLTLDFGFGLCFGLALGIGVAFFRAQLKPRPVE
jgi:uncharacterized protein involved in exopolysaccharide biosynthesis